MEYHITLPFTKEDKEKIKAGDILYLDGVMYSARDAAHKRMSECLEKGEKLPIDLKGQVIYYLGPTPARPGSVIGSAGPTTSSRMDKYTPDLLDLGLSAMIGKGKRSEKVLEAIKRNRALYLGATGGAGALLSKCIKKSDLVAYEDLGTEAIRRLEVKGFPVIVIADACGNYLFGI